jgi:hypothetical protein
MSQAASGIIIQNHRRLPPVSIFSVKIAAVGSSKLVTVRISKDATGHYSSLLFDQSSQVSSNVVKNSPPPEEIS